jgi:hypothetical protein
MWYDRDIDGKMKRTCRPLPLAALIRVMRWVVDWCVRAVALGCASVRAGRFAGLFLRDVYTMWLKRLTLSIVWAAYRRMPILAAAAGDRRLDWVGALPPRSCSGSPPTS